jgi:predicted metal-binding protein
MLHKWNASAKTTNADIVYSIAITETHSESLIDLLYKKKFDELCKSGCPNYQKKWSCPPYSPSYLQFIQGYPYLWIFFMKINLNQFSYIKSNYLKVKAANSILKSKIDKYGREMALHHGKYISTGSCRLCKPCGCKLNMPCKYPNKMSYSFEALGMDVGELVRRYFHQELLWYRKGYVPKYTSVVAGVVMPHSKIQPKTLEYICNKTKAGCPDWAR